MSNNTEVVGELLDSYAMIVNVRVIYLLEMKGGEQNLVSSGRNRTGCLPTANRVPKILSRVLPKVRTRKNWNAK